MGTVRLKKPSTSYSIEIVFGTEKNVYVYQKTKLPALNVIKSELLA